MDSSLSTDPRLDAINATLTDHAAASIRNQMRAPYSPAAQGEASSGSTAMEVIDEAFDDCYKESPSAHAFSYGPQKELRHRDRSAVEYSKSLLNEGDTLVFINYPNNYIAYDATGFALRQVHRVHSGKLLATGSKIFTKLLSDWEQHKARRRKGYLKSLPPQTNFILDLTPPEEGDEALDLTADLSCSPGILKWRETAVKCGVPLSLVGGRDEVVISQNQNSLNAIPISPQNDNSNIPLDNNSGVETKSLGTSEPNKNESSSQQPITSTWTENTRNREPASQPQRAEWDPLRKEDNLDNDQTEEEHELLDYCPIRHRAGIERLLQVIEGKSPRLDSAPKVWTLVMLAKYFDCTSAVVDYVLTWILTEPNTNFIELLPEATLRMGMILENPIMTRYAYAILVSEEAFRIGYNKDWIPTADKDRPYFDPRVETFFSRPREALDEDSINMIQHAGLDFAARIDGMLQRLLDPKMRCFDKLPEFIKLRNFEHWVDTTSHQAPGASEERKSVVKDLVESLSQFVRGRILWTFLQPLKKSRAGFLSYAKLTNSSRPLDWIWNLLSDREKVTTKFYWEILCGLDWGRGSGSNWLRDPLPHRNTFRGPNYKLADAFDIQHISLYELANYQTEFNAQVLTAIQVDGFHNGQVPVEAYPLSAPPPRTRLSPLILNFNITSPTAESSSAGCDPLSSLEGASKSQSTSLNEPLANVEEGTSQDAMEIDRKFSDGFPLQPPFQCFYVPCQESFQLKKECATHMTQVHNWKPYIQPPSAPYPCLYSPCSRVFLYESFCITHMMNTHNWLLTSPDATKPARPSEETKIPAVPLYDCLYHPCEQSFSSLSVREDHMVKDHKYMPDLTFPCSYPQCQQRFLHEQECFEHMTKIHGWKGKFLEDSSSTLPIPETPDLAKTPQAPRDERIGDQSVFFSLPIFFKNLEMEITKICSKMLDKGENEWSKLCETILCLEEEEYKYLPLWAGGHDDGSGGVYEMPIPNADKGPMGPGPGFHTGSTANSLASSEFDDSDFGGVGSSVVGSSVGVENGWGSHLDRRVVISDDGFGTETGTVTSGTVFNGSARVSGGGGGDSDDDSFFLVENEDEEMDLDEGDDDDDDDGALTDRE